jgi:hypothetical protein
MVCFGSLFMCVMLNGSCRNAKGHKNDVTDVGRVVQIREFKDGRRSVKGPKVWPFSLFCFGLGALFLYVGISKKIPEAFYWPPAAHIHLA